MAGLPCCLCGEELNQRITKNKKPYFVCDACGTQFFVRRKQGIKKLEQLLGTIREHNLTLREHTQNLFEISAIVNELFGVEREYERVESSISIFSKAKKEKRRALAILRKRMQKLVRDLERFSG